MYTLYFVLFVVCRMMLFILCRFFCVVCVQERTLTSYQKHDLYSKYSLINAISRAVRCGTTEIITR